MGDVGVEEFVDYMKEQGVIITVPDDARFLALNVLVMGWSWAPFLAHSTLQACMGHALARGLFGPGWSMGPPRLSCRVPWTGSSP